jgi:hypothetical protein
VAVRGGEGDWSVDGDIFFTAKNEKFCQFQIKFAIELTCRKLGGLDSHPRRSGVAGNHQRGNAREQLIFFAEGGDHRASGIRIRTGKDSELYGKSIFLESVFSVAPEGGH